MEAKFKIGDRVMTGGSYTGKVVDIIERKSTSKFYYEIIVDGKTSPEKCLYTEDELEPVSKKGYSMDIKIDIASNVVIATLYEETEDTKSPLAKGHGHMIHEGATGVAQAASYACKKLYESLGGTIVKGGSWK